MSKFKLLKYDSIYKRYYFFPTLTFLLKIVLVNLISVKNIRNLNNYISEIHLVIKGKGTQNILDDTFITSPSEVIVNGISKGNLCQKTCDLDEDINNVIIKFDKQIKSCSMMFNQFKNIIEIDLSNFDASEVNDMQFMFTNCENLEKINFGNINTSSVENLRYLFSGCAKLISIDLSKINTSNVKDMESTFSHCTNLKYLDLSNFDTSNVQNMNWMFYNCQSLIYLNLNSFHLSDTLNMDKMFGSIPPYIKICANDGKMKNILSLNGLNSECSDKCFTPTIKIDVERKQCIESCLNNEYEYELNNICYHECPKNSFFILDDELDNNNFENIKKCYDKTPEGYYL